jgi:PAS domain S-box-containing protein
MSDVLPPAYLRYGAAFAATALGVLARWPLQPLLEDIAPFVTFYLAILVGSSVGGLGPGLMATALSALVVAWAPAGFTASFDLSRLGDRIALGLFVLVGVITSVLSEAFHRARRRAASAHRRLQESEDRYHTTLASIGDGVIATDLEGRITFLNSVARHLTGWGEAALGRPLREVFVLVDASSRRPVDGPATRVLRDGRVQSAAHQAVLLALDGREVCVADSAAPVRDQRGVTRGVVVVFRDVTEMRRAEEARERLLVAEQAVREKDERLRAFVQASILGVVTADIHGRVLEANDELLRILGCTRAELEKGEVRWDALTPPEWLRVDALHIAEARQSGVGARYEKEYQRPDGSRVPVLIGFVLVGPAREEAVAFVLDISDRKRLEAELRQRNEQLQELDRRKDDFLALLGHELRNPLAPIRNAVELLCLGADDPAIVERARDTIRRQAGQMTRLVDELLDASRIVRGKVELRRERLDLAAAVAAAAEDHRPELTAAGLSLEVEIPSAPVWIDGDVTRLTQVVGNLLNNSAKFTDPGGRVTLRVREEGGMAVLSVQDSGIGIPPEALARLFEPFSQGETGMVRSTGGLGLGLSVVRGLIELHGGRVQAGSEGPGRGTVFTIWLPLASAPAREDSNSEPCNRVHGGGSKVLIVEDSRDSADSLALVLSMQGFEVAVAYTGPEGVRLAGEVLPDAVVCDLGLPGMTGFEVARALRVDGRTAAALLVCVSGYGQESDRLQAREAGFDETLVKPVDPAVLVRLLARLRG